MKLQIFSIKKFLRQVLIINVDSALKKNESYYSQVLLKEHKNIEKEVIKHITEDMENFSCDLMKNTLKINTMNCLF